MKVSIIVPDPDPEPAGLHLPLVIDVRSAWAFRSVPDMAAGTLRRGLVTAMSWGGRRCCAPAAIGFLAYPGLKS